MGDPKRTKSKYDTPIHPWEKLRLEAEKPLMKEYGLVNKKELWKVSSKLKNFKDTAKKLVASKSSQAVTEKKQMVERMKSYGLITTEELDEILGLEIQQLLDRRLQTLVHKKGLARSIKQARQMITHRHIAVNGVRITAPGYLVKLSEEDNIGFISNSKFEDEAHPERALADASELQKEKVESSKKEEKKEDKKETIEEEPKKVEQPKKEEDKQVEKEEPKKVEENKKEEKEEPEKVEEDKQEEPKKVEQPKEDKKEEPENKSDE